MHDEDNNTNEAKDEAEEEEAEEDDKLGWNRVDVIETRGPVAVIGDIHGRADLLERLVKQLGNMPLFVVGDVCDRGPDTRGVIELLVKHRARGVRGNHEEWLCQYVDGRGFDTLALKPSFGGALTLRSYGIDGKSTREIDAQRDRIPKAHRDWLLSLPAALRLIVDGAPFWIVHAGVASSLAVGYDPVPRMNEVMADSASDLLWRSQDPEDMDELDGPVVYGHVPQRDPIDAGHAIGIDTGCSRGDGALTAVVLPRRSFVTVSPMSG